MENSELIAYLDKRFAETTKEMAVIREEVRHAHVLIEDLRGDIRLLAEGVSAFDGKLENLRTDLKDEIGQVRSLLYQSYGDLDRRIG